MLFRSRHIKANPSSNQPEPSNKISGQSMTDKLVKFKKFAPTSFKEAKMPGEAEEWLNELEGILETLKTEEEDMVSFAKFLLQDEAREWWKIEKANFKGVTLTWKDFREIFLFCYFPTSVCEQKEQEFCISSKETCQSCSTTANFKNWAASPRAWWQRKKTE